MAQGQAHVRRLGHPLQIADRLGADVARIDGGENIILLLARFGQQQQLLHLAGHVLDVAEQRIALVALLRLLGLRADQGERRLQLMRGR